MIQIILYSNSIAITVVSVGCATLLVRRRPIYAVARPTESSRSYVG